MVGWGVVNSWTPILAGLRRRCCFSSRPYIRIYLADDYGDEHSICRERSPHPLTLTRNSPATDDVTHIAAAFINYGDRWIIGISPADCRRLCGSGWAHRSGSCLELWQLQQERRWRRWDFRTFISVYNRFHWTIVVSDFASSVCALRNRYCVLFVWMPMVGYSIINIIASLCVNMKCVCRVLWEIMMMIMFLTCCFPVDNSQMPDDRHRRTQRSLTNCRKPNTSAIRWVSFRVLMW